MRIKIISDGTGLATQVIDAATGEPVEGVTFAKWQLSAGGLATAELHMAGMPVEIEADAQVCETV